MSKLKKQRRSLIGFSFFLLFCLFLSGYFFLNSAFFNLREIEVRGCQLADEQAIEKLSGLTKGTNLFKINKREIIAGVELHPLIKTVHLTRRIPHTVILEIEERLPFAILVGEGEYLVVDVEGVCLKQVEDLQEFNLPLISGLTVPAELTLGEELTEAGLGVALELLNSLEEGFLAEIAEIDASTPYNLTLKMLQGVVINFGSLEGIERKLQIIRELLFENEELINRQTVEYIDLRYQSLPVIKRKN